MTTIAQLNEEITLRRQLGEEAAEQGNRLEAAYQLGYTNALKRWRRAVEEQRREEAHWALLRCNGAVYLGCRRRWGGWRFDRLAGEGPKGLRARVEDGVARQREKALGPVVFLSYEEAMTFNGNGGV